MAKGKGNAASAVQNRPAYSRASFLYQAAALMASAKPAPTTLTSTNSSLQVSNANSTAASTETDGCATNACGKPNAPLLGMSRRLLSHMRSVSRKTNMRLCSDVKHRVCKYCDTLLVEGSTCVSVVENNSRGGRKPWADVLAVACNTCGKTRRFPLSAPRQLRREYRGKTAEELVLLQKSAEKNTSEKKGGKQAKAAKHKTEKPADSKAVAG